jgi:uncharacterized membrane protein
LTRSEPDRRIPWLWAAGLFLVLWGLALVRWRTFLAGYDVGYFDQAAWLISHGHEPFVTMRGLHILGDHAGYLFYPMAWVTRPFAIVPALLGIQAAALAVGVVPLWAIARRLAHLSVGASVALLGAYSLYPALSNIDLYDFHPETVAVPALLAAAYFGLSRRRIPYALCVALTLLTREDMAVPVLFLGVLLMIEGDRRVGLVTAAAALVVGALDVLVVLPHFASGEFVQGNRFSQYGPTLGAAARYMASHPWEVGRDLVRRPNITVVFGLLGSVAFLPLLAPRYLLPGIPLQLAYLLSNVTAAHSLTAQYTVAAIPFVFLAAAFALGPGRRPLLNHRAMVAAALVGFVAFATASPRHQPWEWLRIDRVDQARRAAADLVPDHAPVATTVRMWPVMGEREALYNFPNPFEFYISFSPDKLTVQQRQDHVDWIVLDTADGAQWTPLEIQARSRLLAPGNPLGFRVVYDRAGIVVYTRR